MASSSELRLILNAVDNASAKIGAVTGSVDRLGKMSRGAGDMLAGMGVNISQIINPAMLAGQVLGKMADFTKQSVDETIKYNKEIREMTQVTGLGAEEISRIVQVGDDWGISIEELRTSLAFMNKSGVTPSIENLADLADEYVNTKDKTAFAEKAVKLLGRGYQTLIPILARGGKALRDQTDAVNKNLLATEESITESRKFEVGMDNLNDSFTAFKYTIGNAVIPVLNDLFEELNKQTSGTKDLRGALDDGTITMEQYAIALRDLRTKGIDPAITSTDSWKQKIDDVMPSIEGATEATEGFKDATQDAAYAIYEVNKAAIGKVAIDALNQAFNTGAIDADTYRINLITLMGGMLDMSVQSILLTLDMAALKSELDHGAISAFEYALRVKALYDRLSELDGKTANTYINEYKNYYQGGPYVPKQHGGPVNKGGRYWVGEAGPELFVPNAPGKIIPNNQITNNNNFTMNIHTNAKSSTFMRDFAIMKAMAG